MKSAVLYIHGKGGSAAESRHYEPLFAGCEVVGLEDFADTPWEAGKKIRAAVEELRARCGEVALIANSIGAFFSMHAGIDRMIRQAFFISPIVDMEGLIAGMMRAAGVTEDELRSNGKISTLSGELSWEYLSYVRAHPIVWSAPTAILCGECDRLTPLASMKDFAARHGARLTVMKGGEHWFHTGEQMRFLDRWIAESRKEFAAGQIPAEKDKTCGGEP